MNKLDYHMISEIRAKLKQAERLDLDISELSKIIDSKWSGEMRNGILLDENSEVIYRFALRDIIRFKKNRLEKLLEEIHKMYDAINTNKED